MNIQCARLVLKTSSLSGGDIINSDFLEYVFRNIDLRILLGDMYDKYELFNLSLKSITSSVGGSIGTNTTKDDGFGTNLNQLSVSIYMSGLPFCNQSYKADTNSITNEVLLTNLIFKRDVSTELFLNDQYITFNKNQLKSDLKFRYECISSGVIPADSTIAYPHLVYTFEIYGVDEPKSINQIMNQRIV